MENNKSKNILLAIMGVLILVEIIVRIILIKYSTLTAVTRILSLVLVSAYGFWLYKKPHGNMLKYTMLLHAAACLVSDCNLLLNGIALQVITIIASAALCYCAGRLDRIDQNKYLLPIIGILYLIGSINRVYLGYKYHPGNLLLTYTGFGTFITYITIMIAYFVRYKEHKEAGVSDK